jgi:hypothetical protein
MTAGSNDNRIDAPSITGRLTPVVQRDDGTFAIGWHDDAPGPFETREFAEAVARELAA